MMHNRIGDIFIPSLIAVSQDTPVSETVELMRTHGISCVPVLKDGAPLGVFTERSIVWHVAHRGVDFGNRRIDELMSTPVFTASMDTYIHEAFGIMATNKIRHLIIVDGENRALGVVTQAALIEHIGYEDFLDIKKVRQIMAKTVHCLRKDAILADAFSLMARESISCVIVAEGRRPLGILTERDVGRLVAEGREVLGIRVEDAMSRPLRTISPEMSIYKAARLMKERGIRRLVAVGENGLMEGLATLSDIMRALEGKYVRVLKQVIEEKDAALRETLESLSEKTIYLDNILRSSIDLGIVATDLHLRIAYFNPAASLILGCGSEEVIGRDVREIHIQAGVDPSRLSRAINTVRRGTSYDFSFETREAAGKRFIQARVSGIIDPSQELLGFVLMVRDITERRKAEDAVRFMAYHDSLTGLPNRSLFNERLSLELAHAERSHQKLALMVMDLDRFKEVNDTLGHQAGDVLLKTVALRLKGLLRKNDTVARMGGDEFMVILSEIHTEEDAIIVAEKILSSIDEPYYIDGHEVGVTCSIGISIYPNHGEEAGALIRVADDAMYHAKEVSRANMKSNLQLFHPSIEER